jgi:hypothetical protein
MERCNQTSQSRWPLKNNPSIVITACPAIGLPTLFFAHTPERGRKGAAPSTGQTHPKAAVPAPFHSAPGCSTSMALQTPRRSTRSSLGFGHNINTASSPNLSLAASTAIARKASLNALTAGQSPATPVGTMAGGDGRDIFVGDSVDVPGGMHGSVKFVGNVRGKKGVFAGVELSKEFAPRGKNDGDVDG